MQEVKIITTKIFEIDLIKLLRAKFIRKGKIDILNLSKETGIQKEYLTNIVNGNKGKRVFRFSEINYNKIKKLFK